MASSRGRFVFILGCRLGKNDFFERSRGFKENVFESLARKAKANAEIETASEAIIHEYMSSVASIGYSEEIKRASEAIVHEYNMSSVASAGCYQRVPAVQASTTHRSEAESYSNGTLMNNNLFTSVWC